MAKTKIEVEPLKQTCRECPFQRKAPKGYLGAASWDPHDFIAPHWHGDVPLPCHMTVNWHREDTQEQMSAAPLCHGFLVFGKNQCKSPLNPEVADAMEAVEPDTTTIFQWFSEFITHHSKKQP